MFQQSVSVQGSDSSGFSSSSSRGLISSRVIVPLPLATICFGDKGISNKDAAQPSVPVRTGEPLPYVPCSTSPRVASSQPNPPSPHLTSPHPTPHLTHFNSFHFNPYTTLALP